MVTCDSMLIRKTHQVERNHWFMLDLGTAPGKRPMAAPLSTHDHVSVLYNSEILGISIPPIVADVDTIILILTVLIVTWKIISYMYD